MGSLQPGCKVEEGLYQIVQFRVIAEEGFVLLLLLVDKVLDVHVKAGGGDALRALGGLFTFLKQQRQEREKRVPAGTSRAHTCAHRDQPVAGAEKPPGSLSSSSNTSFPRVQLLEDVPSPQGLPRWQHFVLWHEGPLLGPQRAPTFSLWSDKLHGEVITLQRCLCPF